MIVGITKLSTTYTDDYGENNRLELLGRLRPNASLENKGNSLNFEFKFSFNKKEFLRDGLEFLTKHRILEIVCNVCRHASAVVNLSLIGMSKIPRRILEGV